MGQILVQALLAQGRELDSVGSLLVILLPSWNGQSLNFGPAWLHAALSVVPSVVLGSAEVLCGCLSSILPTAWPERRPT